MIQNKLKSRAKVFNKIIITFIKKIKNSFPLIINNY